MKNHLFEISEKIDVGSLSTEMVRIIKLQHRRHRKHLKLKQLKNKGK